MKRCIAGQVLIIRVMLLASCTLCLVQPQVHAQEMNGYLVMLPSVGLSAGQTLRLTLFKAAGEPVRVQPQLRHSGGILVGMGDGSVRFLQPGVSESFDFSRSEIPLTGEAGTGRIQLQASCYIRMAQPWSRIDGLAVSMETIEISDGTSNTVFFSEATPSSPRSGGNDDLVGDDGRDAATQAFFIQGVLIGFVPGETLRVTLFNPPSETQHRISGHVKAFDGSGGLLAQSAELVIPPAEFRSFNFNRDELSSPGEPGTNRQQVRVKPFFEFRSERLSRVLASFEIVDNSTGKTKVLLGQECLVFYLGGVPGN